MAKDKTVSGVTSSRRLQLIPSHSEMTDAFAILALGIIAILEFQSTFGGVSYLIVSVLGLLLGIALSHLTNVLKQPAIVLVAMFVAAFFLLGGAVALRSSPGADVLPTGSTLKSLATVSVYGWKDLLTTLPRVDGVGTLLALPYLLGLFCGLGGYALASRTRLAFAPILAPLGVFVSVILLGSVDPAHIVLLSCVFAAGALLWGTTRSNRIRPIRDTGSGQASRLLTSGALVIVAALGAALLGGHIPGASAQDRVVLRKYVNPPANIDDYVSPLSEFRHYVGQQKVNGKSVSLADHELMSVNGSLPTGTPIRFATLDRYNGVVWAASTDREASFGVKPNSFIRVGKTLDNPAPGRTYSMVVEIDDYSDYWMPTAGAVQALSFTDTQAAKQADEFRYNLATGSGVEPVKLTKGASYELTVADVKQPVLKASDNLATDGYTDAGAFLKEPALTLAGTSGSPTARVLKMAASLRSIGRFTHGDPGSSFQYYLPGHSIGRLNDFVKGVLPGVLYVGDDEQYASAFALMVQQLGVPARVVLGVQALPDNHQILGSDVDAWVEVKSIDGTWRTIPTDAFMDKNNTPDKKQLNQKQKQQSGSVVPPPAQGRPKTTNEDAAQSNSDSASQRKRVAVVHTSFHLPAWVHALLRFLLPPLLLVLIVGGVIIGVKTLRRRRRMLKGEPSVRLVRGWKELTDHARDLGTTVPGRLTRREQARHIGVPEVASLARLADEHVFSPGTISDDEAHQFWKHVAQTRKQMSASVGRRRRLLAAVNLSTFFPARPLTGTS